MFFTVLSPKYQMTLGAESRRALGLKPGMRMKGTVKDGKVILEPVPDIMECYGALKGFGRATAATIAEETEAAELAMVEDVLKSMRFE